MSLKRCEHRVETRQNGRGSLRKPLEQPAIAKVSIVEDLSIVSAGRAYAAVRLNVIGQNFLNLGANGARGAKVVEQLACDPGLRPGFRRPGLFSHEEPVLDTSEFSMAVIPGEDEQLVVRSGTMVRIPWCATFLTVSSDCVALQAKSHKFKYRFSTLLRYAFWLA